MRKEVKQRDVRGLFSIDTLSFLRSFPLFTFFLESATIGFSSLPCLFCFDLNRADLFFFSYAAPAGLLGVGDGGGGGVFEPSWDGSGLRRPLWSFLSPPARDLVHLSSLSEQEAPLVFIFCRFCPSFLPLQSIFTSKIRSVLWFIVLML